MEILVTEKSEHYELIDSGEGMKLEKYGSVVLARPENQAIWSRTLKKEEWDKAHATYLRTDKTGKWDKISGFKDEFKVDFEGFKFNLKLLPSKHLGLFPEQSQNWKWLENKIKSSGRKVQVLNLFAHTGGATLACSRAGAEVVHLDASEFPVKYAKKNLEDSGMAHNKVRFIVDDVRKFIEREIKRGNKYDVVIMDPPVYGKGTNGKVWKIEEDLIPLINKTKQILSPDPIAFMINGYASIYSSLTYKNILEQLFSGNISHGELAVKESSSGKILSSGIFARWEK